MRRLLDSEDRELLARGLVLWALGSVTLVGTAAVIGLAVRVFWLVS